jgi:hypothetical protein
MCRLNPTQQIHNNYNEVPDVNKYSRNVFFHCNFIFINLTIKSNKNNQ